MSNRKRTTIEDLSQPARELTSEVEKKVRGGVGLQQPASGATRLSINPTYIHEGGHTAEDSEFDDDKNS